MHPSDLQSVFLLNLSLLQKTSLWPPPGWAPNQLPPSQRIPKYLNRFLLDTGEKPEGSELSTHPKRPFFAKSSMGKVIHSWLEMEREMYSTVKIQWTDLHDYILDYHISQPVT